ncbi:MAG: glycoside hydrolase family 3 C-terminal domain-containing protein [Parabacteroides merdae]
MTFVSGFMRIQKRTYPVCLGRGYKNEDQSIEQAVQAARESEIAIVVVGIEEGEFRDRGYLALPGRQEELIRRVAATGKPLLLF